MGAKQEDNPLPEEENIQEVLNKHTVRQSDVTARRRRDSVGSVLRVRMLNGGADEAARLRRQPNQ